MQRPAGSAPLLPLTLLTLLSLTMDAGCTDERLGFVVVDAAVAVDSEAPEELAEITITAHIYGRRRAIFSVEDARGVILDEELGEIDMALDYAAETSTLEDTYLEFEGTRVTLHNVSLRNQELMTRCGDEALLFLVYDDGGERLASPTEVTITCP